MVTIVTPKSVYIDNNDSLSYTLTWTNDSDVTADESEFEILYRIKGSDTWLTTGVQSNTSYDLRDIYGLLGIDFTEIQYKIRVHYYKHNSEELNNYVISGTDESEIYSLIFDQGSQLDLKIYDGSVINNYPLFDNVSDGTNTININVDNSIKKLPLVDEASPIASNLKVKNQNGVMCAVEKEAQFTYYKLPNGTQTGNMYQYGYRASTYYTRYSYIWGYSYNTHINTYYGYYPVYSIDAYIAYTVKHDEAATYKYYNYISSYGSYNYVSSYKYYSYPSSYNVHNVVGSYKYYNYVSSYGSYNYVSSYKYYSYYYRYSKTYQNVYKTGNYSYASGYNYADWFGTWYDAYAIAYYYITQTYRPPLYYGDSGSVTIGYEPVYYRYAVWYSYGIYSSSTATMANSYAYRYYANYATSTTPNTYRYYYSTNYAYSTTPNAYSYRYYANYAYDKTTPSTYRYYYTSVWNAYSYISAYDTYTAYAYYYSISSLYNYRYNTKYSSYTYSTYYKLYA